MHRRSAEGLLSEAVTMRAKAERAKTLLKARLTAVSRGCERSGIVGGEARPAVFAAGGGCGSSQSSPLRGHSRCRSGVDRGTAMTSGRKGRLPFRSSAGGGGEEREKQSPGAVEASLDESPPLIRKQQQQQQLEEGQKKTIFNGPGRYPQELEQERNVEHSPRNRDRQRPDPEQQQQPTVEKNRRKCLGEEDSADELERIKQEMERQRRDFEVERQAFERKLEESSLAAENAENRAGELEAAWQALTEKVLSLVGRNADLEWVSESASK